jgi:heat-inducible transcriptional repressor
VAGAIALLGPMRIPYRNLIGLSRLFSEYLSRALTESIYKYKITFRQPKTAGEITNTSILLEKK